MAENIKLKEALENSNKIMNNCVSTELLDGYYWALIHPEDNLKKKYADYYNNIVNAGFYKGELVKRNTVLGEAQIYTFTTKAIKGYFKSLYPKPEDSDAGKALYEQSITSIKRLKAQEMKALAVYCHQLFTHKHNEVIIGLYNKTGQSKITQILYAISNNPQQNSQSVPNSKSNKSKSKAKVNKVQQERKCEVSFNAYSLEINDIVTINKQYLYTRGFIIKNVSFVDIDVDEKYVKVSLELAPVFDSSKLNKRVEIDPDLQIEDEIEEEDDDAISIQDVKVVEAAKKKASEEDEFADDEDDEEDDDYDFGELE